MARLDRLGPAKEVAQIGSAIGREFSHPLLAAVARKSEPCALGKMALGNVNVARGSDDLEGRPPPPNESRKLQPGRSVSLNHFRNTCTVWLVIIGFPTETKSDSIQAYGSPKGLTRTK